MQLTKYTMHTGDVARVLEVSVGRVHQLDDQLKPIRAGNGRRRYDPAVVKRVAEARAVRAGE